MAKGIVKLIPEDAKNYVEPFAGSLAVLLRKEPHQCEVVNDLDNRLVAFWRVLRDKPDELQRALTFTPYARAEFEHVLSVIDDPCDDVEFARRVFVILRQSRKRSTSAIRPTSTPRSSWRATASASALPPRTRNTAWLGSWTRTATSRQSSSRTSNPLFFAATIPRGRPARSVRGESKT